MERCFLRTRFILGLVAVHAIGFAGECHAGSFLDWLRGRSPYYAPWNTTALYGATAGASAPMSWRAASPVPGRIAFQGGTVLSSRMSHQNAVAFQHTMPSQGIVALPPTAGCPPTTPGAPSICPPTAASPTACPPYGAPAAQPIVANYAPQVRYRTTWVPVPVTRYRPVMATDPTTGCPTTSLQPCNAYTWQLRRVPVVQYRPIWSRPSWCRPRLPWFTAPALAPSSGCCTTAPAQAMPQPYYAPQPGGTTRPSTGETPGAPTPADEKPSLSPETRVQDSAANPLPYRSPLAGPEVNAGRAPATNPTSSESLRRPVYVKPLPDPEAERERPPSYDDPPQLLNPRERTAGRAPWAVVPITWPMVTEPTNVQRVPGAARDPQHWDDRGWRSER